MRVEKKKVVLNTKILTGKRIRIRWLKILKLLKQKNLNRVWLKQEVVLTLSVSLFSVLSLHSCSYALGLDTSMEISTSFLLQLAKVQ